MKSDFYIYAHEYKIDESLFKPDLDAAIKYQEFSAELLRISILSLGIIGFFITNLREDFVLNKFFKSSLNLGMISFILCCACSLFHRYYSTESMASIIRFLRCSFISTNEKDAERKKHFEDQALKEKIRKNKLFKLCSCLIILSIIFIILGAISLILCFIFGM